MNDEANEAEGAERTFDLTPEALRTPEGAARVEEASLTLERARSSVAHTSLALERARSSVAHTVNEHEDSILSALEFCLSRWAQESFDEEDRREYFRAKQDIELALRNWREAGQALHDSLTWRSNA